MGKKQEGQRGGTRAGAGRPAFYGERMGTCELRLDARRLAWLGAAAKRGRCSRSAIVRQLIDGARKRRTKGGE
jgi:hypothetical protein